jgi:hypothetical protein
VNGPMHQAWDPQPGPGTALAIGSKSDRVNFVRGDDGRWMYWHNGDRARVCSYDLVLFWAPLDYVCRPRGGRAR